VTDPIYLDHNATTPLAPEVGEAMAPFLSGAFGNPSSGHAYGRAARKAVDRGREQVAELLGAHPDEIVFTGGGSEADNAAIKGIVRGPDRVHLVTTAIEHPAVLEPARYLARLGHGVDVVGVNGVGRVDPDEVGAACTAVTSLVSVMLANNEVGTLQPVAEIAAMARGRGILVHSDAAQAVGKIPVRVDDLGVDLLTVAGHKLYGPKGVGALYVRRGTGIEPFLHGAGHEGGRRAGTENTLGIVGLGAACALALREGNRRAEHATGQRERLERGLRLRIPDLVVHAEAASRLPNTSSVAIPRVAGAALLAAIRDRVAASGGAACHADGTVASDVLRAMKVDPEVARGTIRLSTGRATTDAEIDEAVAVIADAADRLRSHRG
jgi:cysteine desulfurase